MRDAMRARGPDGYGEWQSENGMVALGHRRLSIIDLSDRAAQPMRSEDGQLVVTFNGEIYNHVALRQELEKQGHVFRTSSDTEVLLHLYADRGADMLSALRGMFAFALWDGRARTLLLARDPYGIKPLYYAADAQVLRFASQVRALVASGQISRAADPAAQVGFYLWGSVPEPFTRYRAVRALPAGTLLRVDEQGVGEPRAFFSIARIWSTQPQSMSQGVSERQAQELIREALSDSVAHHLVADVPVSAFLSGGVDSGAIVGLARDNSNAELRGITLGFAEFETTEDDEIPAARVLADHYGLTHSIRRVSETEFRADLPRILAAMDQPSIDGINTWFVSKATAELGCKVAVSGLGGDELFGGYDSFQEVPKIHRFASAAGHVPGLGVGMRFAATQAMRAMPRLHPKLAGLAELGGTWPGAYFMKRGLFMPWELSSLLPEQTVVEGIERLNFLGLLSGQLLPKPSSAFGIVSTLESAQYMRNQLLRDADWASMAHSLEVRVPLVDATLLSQIAPLLIAHPRLRAKAGLADAPRKAWPRSLQKRGKTGFSTPVARWLRSAPGLDSWRRVPALQGEHCPWARRFAFVVALSTGLHE